MSYARMSCCRTHDRTFAQGRFFILSMIHGASSKIAALKSLLRELIRAVRACKTAAEEREVIAKESAAIRSAFKDEDNQYRHRNVAKMLFMHMLGYPTHFGQMECIKLIAAPRFPEKRIGYLGLMLLLDENVEVLMLITNSLKSDFENTNQYISGLALTALGNIASADIARDLASEIEKMMGNSNGYLRKKACLCAVRLVRKCPEMCEGLFPHLQSLLQDRTHGVLIGALTLIQEICALYPRAVSKLQPLVPVLVRMLKNLVLSGYSPEYDVCGITDPFLQVKLLRVMRMLAADREDAAEQMSDILAQVATNTESTKNAGNAVLYECVLTIMGIPCEAGLRVLGVNILGRFLMNRDNNIRYVALNTLAKVAPIDATSVQRHRNTIVDCLRDNDISIRRRALDLIALLCTEQNIRALAKEMLNYLSVCDPEFEPDLTEKLCSLVAKWAPSRKWHVDTMVRVLIIAGNSVPPSVLPTLVQLISSAPELQIYAVHKFFNAIAQDRTKPVLLQVAVWCIGEFGELLSVAPPGDGGDPLPSDSQVIDIVAELLAMENPTLKGYCLNALVKLTTRLAHGMDRIKSLIAQHKGSVALDLQQRAVEYHALFKFDEIRRSVVETLPTNEDFEEEGAAEGGAAAERRQRQSLLDDDEELAAPVTQKSTNRPQTVQQPAASTSSSKSIMDDLLGLSVPTTAPAQQQLSAMDLLSGLTVTPGPSGMGYMQTAPLPTAAPSTTNGTHTIQVYDADGVRISFLCVKDPNDHFSATITATYSNVGGIAISNFVVQAAVPKTAKVTLSPATGTSLSPSGGNVITQVMRVSNTIVDQKALAMRMKISYTAASGPVTKTHDVTNFPPGI